MTIRNARVEDKVAITELAENCAPMVRPSVVGTYEFLARCFSNTFFVYEENSKILGFVVGFPNTAKEGEFWIYQVCVNDKLWGKQIGTKLFERIFKQVRAEGYVHVKSHFKFKNSQSRALHEKFGMTVSGQDDRGYFVEVEL